MTAFMKFLKRRVGMVWHMQPSSSPPVLTGLCCSTGCRLSYYYLITTVGTVFLALTPRLPNQQIKEKS